MNFKVLRIKKQWAACTLCNYEENCNFKSHYREIRDSYDGTISALFVLEAPTEIESSLKRPAVHPAGKFLERKIDLAQERNEVTFGYAFTNAIACSPLAEKPTAKEIENCSMRLLNIIQSLDHLAAIITCGPSAKKAVDRVACYDAIVHHIMAPEKIIAQGERGLLDTARLNDSLDDLCHQLGSVTDG